MSGTFASDNNIAFNVSESVCYLTEFKDLNMNLYTLWSQPPYNSPE